MARERTSVLRKPVEVAGKRENAAIYGGLPQLCAPSFTLAEKGSHPWQNRRIFLLKSSRALLYVLQRQRDDVSLYPPFM